MTAEALLNTEIHSLSPAIHAALNKACGFIAPTWPLDQMIAVNPLWELRHYSYQDAAARLAARGNIRSHLAPETYDESAGVEIAETHLARAAAKTGGDASSASGSTPNEDSLGHWLNISDLLDQDRDAHQMSWHEEIIHQISQFCADSFQSGGPCADDAPGGTLYRLWLDCIRDDRGVAILMAAPGLRQEFSKLPDTRDALFSEATGEFDLQEIASEAYAHSLLLDINGWASWIAYLRWQARLQGGDSDLMMDLLAIRMAWDLALWRFTREHRSADFRRVQSHWQQQVAVPGRLVEEHRSAQQPSWQWQTAAELAYQQDLSTRLREQTSAAEPAVAPALQAVFCIDVRSEVLRRHLEAQDDAVQTKGFAGFFGLPIQFQAADSDFKRPQLPGLLAPAMSLRAASNHKEADRNQSTTSWSNTADSPTAMFSLVEASGPYYLWKLLRDSFYPATSCDPASKLADKANIELLNDEQQVLTLDERVELAAGVLHAMSLEENFAPTVLLVGHGAESPNNPQAASLNCGACGGQSGEFNSLLLASLLNNADVRSGLADRGVNIPEQTRFVAALHETVTDDLRVVDDSELDADAQAWMEHASAAARRERASKLGLGSDSDAQLDKALKKRARDWSQVRPEWGLAGNAAFIVAPRQRTRGIDLQGKTFLHDYNWQNDSDLSVLELIMTAPMVVTNWINMQYNASVVDNERYGSGNKVLHNVVGGNIGVFEGNGGDLRIGLPMQSVHDGDKWMHLPLRLSVFIAAPAEAIKEIYQRHEVVKQLVDNDWLYLFQLDDEGNSNQLYKGKWTPVGSAN